jgi:hypothetical protein
MLTSSNLLAEYLVQDPNVLTTASALGLEIESIQVLSIRPDPEMASAMQAEARERLLQQADEAVHERRKTAIELEREIRENELNTERSVQEKKREVRQAELDADVAIEKGRSELVGQKAENDAKEAEVQIETMRAMLDSMREVDWRTMVASKGNVDSKQLIAMAFGELAENARKIGRLDISPDLLGKLMDEPSENGSEPKH